MKSHPKHFTMMTVSLLALVIISMSFGNAYAHKAEVVGDYKIEIGWDQEPPIQGIENSIELVITHATEAEKEKAYDEDMAHDEEHDEDMAHDEEHDEDMAHDEEHDEDMAHDEEHEHEGGVSGLEEMLQVTVTLGDDTHTISMSETDVDGIYLGKFTPSESGHPVVHLMTTIHDAEIDLDMHPEEVESLNTLPPLKQINHGIAPDEVQCKEGLELFMRINEDSAICASDSLGQRLMELGVVDYF